MQTLAEFLETDLSYVRTALKSELAALAGKNLLITGGGGFLGYYLVHAVVSHNAVAARGERIQLTVFENFRRGVPAWLIAFQKKGELRLQEHDVSQPLPPLGAFQFIIHAAGIASPTYYRKFPLETMDTNINGLRSLLDYARNRANTSDPVEGFLFFSSSEIYGDPAPDQIPTREDYRGYVSCTGPRACYDESKRYGETMCVVFSQQYGVPVKVARPFNNYGPGLKISDRRVIPDLARDLFAGRDLVLLSDGTAKRTFCYSADAIIGYYKVLVRGRGGEAYNIGIERPEITMNELAEKVAGAARELFGYGGRIVYQASTEAAYLVDNPNRRCPNITKARTELGFDPTILVDEGLKRSLVWYSHNNSGEDA